MKVSLDEVIATLHAAAHEGDIDGARQLASMVERCCDLTDNVRAAVGQAYYLIGDARGCVRLIEGMQKPTSSALMALSASYAALAQVTQEQSVAMMSDSGICVEDVIGVTEDLTNYRHPEGSHRGWGAPRHLAAGDFRAAYAEMLTIGEHLPGIVPGARELFLRSGRRLRRWEGEKVDHLAVLLTSGSGDVFCFGRYLASLQGRAARITVIVGASSMRLLEQHVDADRLVPSNDCSDALNAADAYVCEWLLPYLSGAGYGRADWLSRGARRARRQRKLQVGLAWAGSGCNQAQKLRSVPVEALEPLLGVRGVTFHSLMVGKAAEQAPAGIVDHSGELGDFADTAKLVAGLDLVISVDTAVANLAGAMSVPLWLLAHHDPDFRWVGDGDRTPWFPCARIVKQRTPGDWHAVVDSAARQLCAMGA